MKVTKSFHTAVKNTSLLAVILLYCFLVAAGSDVTVFDQDDDIVVDDSVRTLFDLENLFDDELSSPASPIKNNNDNNNNDNKYSEADGNIGDIEVLDSNKFSQSDNTISKDWDPKRTNRYSNGVYSSDFSSLSSPSSFNSSWKQTGSNLDADSYANQQRLDWPDAEDNDLIAEELYLPIPQDSYNSRAALSRFKRDLTAGSGEELLRTQLVAQGTPTAEELQDGSLANNELKLDVAGAILRYLQSTNPGEVFQTEVTQVSSGSYIFDIDIVYDTDRLTIVNIATSYDSLTTLNTGGRIFTILEKSLVPSTGSSDLRPAICYLCDIPPRAQDCTFTPREDGTQFWFCSTNSTYYYAFGLAQGDSTLQRDDEFTTERISITSRFPYLDELVTDVYISVNGIISFEAPFASFDVRPLPVGDLKLLAVYWTDLDLTLSDSAADVFYQLYTKSPTNTDSQQAIFTKANADVVSLIEGVTSYDATNVIVVTWEAIPPWPGSPTAEERVHFQAAIITDGSSTYVSYVYSQGGMGLDPLLNRRVAVGWGSNNFSPTPNSTYYEFDTVIGNKNLPGFWFFQIGDKPNSRALCLGWYNERNTPANRAVIQVLNFLVVPPCPCSERTAFRNFFWVPSLEQPRCYDMFPLLGPLGRRCCYRLDGSLNFENRRPFAGNLQLYTPYFGDLQNHELEDVNPKRWCCFESELCALYYQLRPTRNCISRRNKRCLLWGDPHIKTLDGKDYIFNGLGEYTIMTLQGTYEIQTEINGTSQSTPRTVNFELQGRTCRSRTASGNLTSATQWCALAGRDTDNSTFRIGLAPTGTVPYLEIYVNDEDYSARFRDDPNFSTFEGELSLRRVNESLSVYTPDNLGISVTLAGDVIEMSFEVDENLKGLSKGLFGNFNDDITDDLAYRNGTTVPITSSEEEIFHMGQSWAIAPEDSLFVYEFGRNSSFYSDPNFQPLFLENVDPAVIANATAECQGDNNACIFDYIATQNINLAQQSGIAIETFDQEEAEISNEAPNITQVDIETTVNETTTFVISAFDLDGDNIQFIVLETPNEGQLEVTNSSDSVRLAFTPASTNPVSISVVAQDANGLQSEISEVTIRNCGGCNGHGTCNYNTFIIDDGSYYTLSPCTCDLPYSGNNCENDKNGCEGDPCPTGTSCDDIPAVEEDDLGRAYNCSDCPAGYQLTNDSTKCIDIDECKTNTDNCDSNANCTNTVGSHFCTCINGYRKSVFGEICADIDECIENNHKCSQICTNTIGGYDCSCNEGFEVSGLLSRNCTKLDIDPCETLQHNCSYGCRNKSGEAECFCEAGFRVDEDGFSCRNIDECDDKLLCAQICIDNRGSYTCSCHAGYSLNVDEHDCDRCTDNRWGLRCEKVCDCRGRATACDPVQGCICTPQWSGENCLIDVNECETENICPEDKSCVNTNGSYYCACPVGFQDPNNDGTCTDIDECATASIHQCPQNCQNNPGSFQCVCNGGYNYNTTRNTCDDINECLIGTSGCIQRCENTVGSFNCFCEPGYVLDEDRKTCFQEQDLCTNKAEPCSQGCTVVEGVPTCICTIGFFLGTDGSSCFDVNECMSDTLNRCSDFCDNTNGSYTCNCPSGKQLQNDFRTCTACDDYHWGRNCANECACDPIGTARCDPIAGCICNGGRSGDQCQNDINECVADVSPCPANSDCIDIVGSYVCNCRTGYQLNASGECEDINECSNSPCDHTCTNVIGSYLCSCFVGFNPDGDRCLDINECDQPAEVHGCQQSCRNTQGSYTCLCFEGFRLNTTNRRICVEEVDRTTCLDNNTCDTGCRLENGIDTCFCNPGFQLSTVNSSVCENINECNTSQPCVGGTCEDNIGGFDCTCEAGFRLSGDQITCLACEENTYGVGCGERCTCDSLNTQECRPDNGTCICISGYNGTNCETDINECQNGEAECQNNSECQNLPGSYRCVCQIGFATADNECTPCSSTTYGTDCASQCICVATNTEDCNDVNGTCTCKAEWKGADCSQDVNECNDTSVCPGQNEVCQNSPGSFECVCENGFTRISGVCIDIDECLTVADICNSNQTCTNTQGGHFCTCAPGFLDDNGKCLDIDECDERTDTCNSNETCTNKVGGYTCLCSSGYSKNNGDCLDINECMDEPDKCNSNQTCINNVGGYTCPCSPGFTDVNGNCLDIDECQLNTDKCQSPRVCLNTVGNFTCECGGRYLENDNGICIESISYFNATIVFNIGSTVLDPNTFVAGSPENLALIAAIEARLEALGSEAVNADLQTLIVKNIRAGLEVDIEIGINQVQSDNTASSASLVINSFFNASAINVSSTLPSATAQSGVIDGTTISAGASTCTIFNTLTTCGSGFECRATNGVPSCQEIEDDDDDNYELIIGLGVGIPLFIILVIIIACAVCLCLRKSRRTERESTASADRDAPFRSVFARQMATKSSLGSPHRFSPYSPDAYSEAGTSESSGDGQLLKSRQKNRPDFQDSPWYDNRGGTPREPTESQGAPTEAGAGPTSNFSWEYMFRLLEPHRGFEIQRPYLSPAPNPTYTPRGKNSESPA